MSEQNAWHVCPTCSQTTYGPPLLAAHPADSAEALMREALEAWVDLHNLSSKEYEAKWHTGHPVSFASGYDFAMEKARAALQASAPSPGLAASGTRKSAAEPLRDALRHYDENAEPGRSTEQLSAREWRDAYFVLARIAIKQLAIERAAAEEES